MGASGSSKSSLKLVLTIHDSAAWTIHEGAAWRGESTFFSEISQEALKQLHQLCTIDVELTFFSSLGTVNPYIYSASSNLKFAALVASKCILAL